MARRIDRAGAGARRPLTTALAGALAAATLAACGGGDESGSKPAPSGSSTGSAPAAEASAPSPAGGEQASQADLVARGERVYNVNCIACHHRDPTQDGGLGPAVAGSSRELVEARVLRAEYPPGYTPKSDTRLMVALKHLEPEIDALTAYLNSVQ